MSGWAARAQLGGLLVYLLPAKGAQSRCMSGWAGRGLVVIGVQTAGHLHLKEGVVPVN